MNSLKSLYYPGTTICSTSQYPLFLLFPNLYLLSIAESNIHGNRTQAIDSFIKSGYCQVHTPSPLGKDLERFIHLVNDLKNRKDDYASQLSSLTLAAMSTPGQNSRDSRQEIVSSLLGESQLLPHKNGDEKKLQLWQARLVLAIGEILDQEEEEIALQLALLKDEEAELFNELQGKSVEFLEENPFEELSLILDNINPPSRGNTKKRFLSWKQLYNEGNIPAYDLLLTTSQDAADLIFESYEKKTDKTAVDLGQLSLPATVGTNEEDGLQAVHAFHKVDTELINTFADKLLQLKNSDSLQGSIDFESKLSSFSGSWEHHLEAHFPAKEFGRIPLAVYGFTDMSCPSLLEDGYLATDQNNGLMVIAETSSKRN